MADIKDDFWDIDKLVPKKEKPRYIQPRRDTEAVEITADPPAVTDEPPTFIYRAVPPSRPAEKPEEPLFEYSPKSPLISSVRVFGHHNNFNYYEQFCADALRIRELTPEPCEHVAYFSYVPQFVQLSPSQLRWYVYFRSCVMSGQYPKTDFSYILLLIFEIINLSDRVDVTEGQRVLCEIWLHYREEYSRLDRHLGEWICDYSLIHRLPPPVGFCDLGIAEYSTLKEFYVYYDESDSCGYANALIRYCSAYDYRKSKFAKGEALALFDRHVPGALAHVLKVCSDPGHILSAAGLDDNLITRDAYNGALCASAVRRRLEISYFSFSRSHELRFIIADIIKYTENKIRAAIGVKSRLGVYSLPDNIQSAIDAYFAEAMPSIPRPRKKERTDEAYEKLYDAPQTELSITNAARIEDASWRVTEMLVEAFDEPTAPIVEIKPEEVAPTEPEEDGDLATALGEEKMAFVRAALEENAAEQGRIARELGLMVDALADEINDTAADIMGDIILEDVGGAYAVIEDYRGIFENE